MKRKNKHVILVVEDEATLRNLLVSKLTLEGYSASGAVDGIEAAFKAKRNPPCLIFLDILLPHRQGFEFLRDLRKDSKLRDTPVFVLTQLGEAEFRDVAEKLGVLEYFVKADHSLREILSKTAIRLADCPRHGKARAGAGTRG